MDISNDPELNGKYLGTVTQDFVKIADHIKEASYQIRTRGFSEYPIFVISKEDSPKTGNDKTSIIFAASHTPGSLYSALGEFAKRGINLTKIESRPTKQKPWEYNFYLDFEGHRSQARCKEVIEVLRKNSAFLKLLGSYPKAKN